MHSARRTLRRFRASWRDTWILLGEFWKPLLIFVFLMIGSAVLYRVLARAAGQEIHSLQEVIYWMLGLAFLQPMIPFPELWYLQLFFYIMPVVGIGILAQGLTDFGILLFNRRARSKEWEMAVASTFHNHIVLVGIGHLGFRVALKLRDLNQEIVVIEKHADPDLLQAVRRLDIPVIEDDGARDSILAAAGVARARVIMLCTQDDNLNLRMALKARNLNPTIEVVIRIFEDDFAASLQTQFGFQAMSATGMAAPLFAAAAAQLDITPPVVIEGQPHILANLQLTETSSLNGKRILDIEEMYRISVVLLCKDGQRLFHPPAEERVQPGQTIAIFGEPGPITRLLHENKS